MTLKASIGWAAEVIFKLLYFPAKLASSPTIENLLGILQNVNASSEPLSQSTDRQINITTSKFAVLSYNRCAAGFGCGIILKFTTRIHSLPLRRVCEDVCLIPQSVVLIVAPESF